MFINVHKNQLFPIHLIRKLLLGVTIDRKLKLNTHINNLITKLKKLQPIIYYIASKLNHTSKLMFYNSFIESNLSYCPSLFALCNLTKLKQVECVRKKLCKILFMNSNNSNLSFLNVVNFNIYKFLQNCLYSNNNSDLSRFIIINLRKSSLRHYLNFTLVTNNSNNKCLINEMFQLWNKLSCNVKTIQNKKKTI